jgi:hypothetical protein
MASLKLEMMGFKANLPNLLLLILMAPDAADCDWSRNGEKGL